MLEIKPLACVTEYIIGLQRVTRRSISNDDRYFTVLTRDFLTGLFPTAISDPIISPRELDAGIENHNRRGQARKISTWRNNEHTEVTRSKEPGAV